MLSKITSKFKSTSISLNNLNTDFDAPAPAPATPPLGPVLRPLDPKVQSALEKAGIPLISCSACASPCDPDHPDATPSEIHAPRLLSAWSKQDIDQEEEMFPSNSPFLRHVLVSTGKKDWVKDVASVKGSLAQMFEAFVEREGKKEKRNDGDGAQTEDEKRATPTSTPVDLPVGCWQTDQRTLTRLFIGNSSQISSSTRENENTVMLFPDYVAISDVADTQQQQQQQQQHGNGNGNGNGETSDESAKWAFDRFISPRAQGRVAAPFSSSAPQPQPRRWVLPHRAIVVLCSHHKRDARCGIAAPMLAQVFRRYAESYGWDVDERGDLPLHFSSSSSIESQWDDELGIVTNRGFGYIEEEADSYQTQSHNHTPERQMQVWRRLAASAGTNSAIAQHPLAPHTPSLGIFYTSHIGKHKYSGNVIVYFPNGAGVWYGRVDPLNGAGRVFEQTILRGKVIPEYLRAGINLYRGGHAGQDDDHHHHQQRVSGAKSEMQSGQQEAQGILRW